MLRRAKEIGIALFKYAPMMIIKWHSFMTNRKWQYIAYLTFFVALSMARAEQPKLSLSAKEIRQLATDIEAAEKRLRNIKIDSEAWVEEKTNLSNPFESWRRTSIFISATAWFDANQRDKVRVDFHKAVTRWKNGEAPYIEEDYSASFDGNQGMYIRNKTSYGGKVFHTNTFSALSEAPYQLKSGWYQKMLGIHASLNFFFSGKDFSGKEETFSNMLKAFAAPDLEIENAKKDPNIVSALKNAGIDPNTLAQNVDIDISFQKLASAECVIISLKGRGRTFRESWWLDPNRGFALLKFERARADKNGKEIIVDSIDVKKLDKVAENIWWPTEVYFVAAPYGVKEPCKRIVYRATSVVANDLNISDSIFTVPTPQNYLERKEEYIMYSPTEHNKPTEKQSGE